MSHGIPEALSFDRIISGGVCPVSMPQVSSTLYYRLIRLCSTTVGLLVLGSTIADPCFSPAPLGIL